MLKFVKKQCLRYVGRYLDVSSRNSSNKPQMNRVHNNAILDYFYFLHNNCGLRFRNNTYDIYLKSQISGVHPHRTKNYMYILALSDGPNPIVLNYYYTT